MDMCQNKNLIHVVSLSIPSIERREKIIIFELNLIFHFLFSPYHNSRKFLSYLDCTAINTSINCTRAYSTPDVSAVTRVNALDATLGY